MLAEINGSEIATGSAARRLHGAEGRRLDARAAAGSTAASTRTASTRRRARSRTGSRTRSSRPSGRWAWPANRRIALQPRVRGSRRQAVVGAQEATCGGTATRMDGRRRARLPAGQGARTTRRPTAPRRRTPSPATTRSSCRRTAARGSSSRRGSRTGRCRRTTSRTSRRSATRCTRRARIRRGRRTTLPEDPSNPSADEPGAELYPYVVTTYRLTEHHTAGGMSRTIPYLVGAAAGDVLRGVARARGRSRARARRLGDDLQRARGDRGARARHRPHPAAHGRTGA